MIELYNLEYILAILLLFLLSVLVAPHPCHVGLLPLHHHHHLQAHISLKLD